MDGMGGWTLWLHGGVWGRGNIKLAINPHRPHVSLWPDAGQIGLVACGAHSYLIILPTFSGLQVDHSHDADHGMFGHRDQCIAENRNNATWIAMVRPAR